MYAAIGIVLLLVGLLLPAIVRRYGSVVPLAAGALAAESLVLMWAHAQHGETAQIAMVAVLGLVMAFVAYGRARLHPIVERFVQRATG